MNKTVIKTNKVYVVTMYRWGNRESHSYILGAYSEKSKALKAAEEERIYRGSKYMPEVLEIELDLICEVNKIIIGLKE